MLRRNVLAFLIFLLPVLGSCSSSSFVTEEENFPLTRSHSVSSDDTIYKLGMSDSFLAFENVNSVQGVDVETDKVVWKVDDISVGAGSDILFTGDLAVITSRDEILLVDNKGQKTFLNLNKKRQDNIRLLAVCENDIYVIRGGRWDLEAYDISANKMIWETWVGRGRTDVFYEPSTDIAYVASPSSVRAFNNSTGELLWQQETDINHSAYENGKLYVTEREFKSPKYSVTALDVITRQVVWHKEFDVDLEMYINGLSIFQHLLIMTTRYGYLAFDLNNGEPKWQTSIEDIFYTKPVLLENTLYTIGSSNTVYAISLKDGHVEGSIRLEPESSFFGESSYEAGGIYLFQDGIAFKARNNVVFYVPK